MEKYLSEGVLEAECLTERAKHGPFSGEYQSKYFDIAIHEECEKGNGFDSMGLRLIVPDKIYDSCYGYIDWLREKGIDVFCDDMILYLHCQGFNGGGYIDKNAQTEFENLFACGEAAGGMHGADRIGGNAISAGLVFGEIAGREAAKKVKHGLPVRNPGYHEDDNTSLKNLIEKNYPFRDTKDAIFPWDVKKAIKEIMHNCAGRCKMRTKYREGCISIKGAILPV